MEDILHFYIIQNYDILIISETGLHQNTHPNSYKAKHSTHSLPSLDHNNFNHKVHIYTDNKGHTKGSGISMIILEQLQKHVIKTTTFLGRILTIDLCFKGNHYIKFICCYLLANASDDKNLIIMCYKEIEKILINATLNHFQCIIIGNLNINLDKMKQSNHYPAWRCEIKNILKNFDLKNTLKFFYNQPSHTHTSTCHDGPDIQSCIDYIFTSINILQHTFYTYTHNVSENLFTTDHKAIGCYLEIKLIARERA